MPDQTLVVDKRRVALDRPLTPEDMTDASLSTLERASILRRPQAEQVVLMLDEIGGRSLGEKLLVLLLPPDDSYGSIVIPETAREDHVCGIIVAVGKGHYENGVLVAPEVQRGNYVVFSKYAGREIKIGDHVVVSISEPDINFVVGPPPDKQ